MSSTPLFGVLGEFDLSTELFTAYLERLEQYFITNSIGQCPADATQEVLAAADKKVLWINMCPTRLPRGFTNLIVGTVYHPPSAKNAAMLNYLSNCLSVMESRFPNCGFIILGDFNKLNTSRLRTGYDLKQLVNFPTCGNNTPDIVLTNLNAFFDQPTKCAPFGLSDHMSIEVRPVECGNIKTYGKSLVPVLQCVNTLSW